MQLFPLQPLRQIPVLRLDLLPQLAYFHLLKGDPTLSAKVKWCGILSTYGTEGATIQAVYTRVTGGYTGWIEEIPGVNTQGKTLVETRRNLADALELVVETNRLIVKQELRGKDVICEPFAIAA